MMKRFRGLLVLVWPAFAVAEPYRIQHVEPMSWWVGMKHPELQVMVHGEKIADLAWS